MKVTKTTANSNRATAEIDLELDDAVPTKVQKEIAQAVGEYLLEKSQTDMAAGVSPVTGRPFKKLSKEYAERKMDQVGNSDPNLELEGDMKDEMSFKADAGSLEYGVFGPSAKKADGHNNLSGESSLPRRPFIPDTEETFRPEIRKGVDSIIAGILAENQSFEKNDFEGVDSKKDLYATLSQGFPGLSRSEIRAAVFSRQDLLRILNSMDLTKLL